MTKLDAFNGLISGEYTSITLDQKTVYSFIDGSVLTPRKKALDMKNMMEDGWIGRSAPKWYDNIGKGIIVSQGGVVYIATACDADGIVSTESGTEITIDAVPLPREKAMALVWNPESIDNKTKKSAKKDSPKEDSLPSEGKVDGDEQEKEFESSEVPDATEPEPESEPEPEIDEGIEEIIPEPEPESKTETGSKLENVKTEDFRATKFFKSMHELIELGLDENDAEEFWGFNKLDVLKMDTLNNAGSEEMIKLIDIFYEEPADPTVNVQEEDEIPFSLATGSVAETEKVQPKKLQQQNTKPIASKKAESISEITRSAVETGEPVNYRKIFKSLGLPSNAFTGFWNHLMDEKTELSDLISMGDAHVEDVIKEYLKCL